MHSMNAVLSRLYGRGLAPTLVPDLDAIVVVFKLDDLHMILINKKKQVLILHLSFVGRENYL